MLFVGKMNYKIMYFFLEEKKHISIPYRQATVWLCGYRKTTVKCGQFLQPQCEWMVCDLGWDPP